MSATQTVTHDEVEFLRRYLEQRWGEHRPDGLVALCPPDDDPGDGDDAGGDDGGGDDDAAGDADDDAGDDDDSADDDGGDDAAERHAEEVGTLKSEIRGLKKRLGDSEKARKKAERERDKARAGEDDEVTELREENETLKSDNDGMRRTIRNGALDRAVAEIAGRLRFKNPALAKNLVGEETRANAVDDDGEVDERLIERELKRIAKADDYLVRPARKAQGDVRPERDRSNGGGGEGGGEGYEFDPRGKMRRGRKTIAVGRDAPDRE
jgi:hypothetical protein